LPLCLSSHKERIGQRPDRERITHSLTHSFSRTLPEIALAGRSAGQRPSLALSRSTAALPFANGGASRIADTSRSSPPGRSVQEARSASEVSRCAACVGAIRGRGSGLNGAVPFRGKIRCNGYTPVGGSLPKARCPGGQSNSMEDRGSASDNGYQMRPAERAEQRGQRPVRLAR
jgi:hypothetical protein